MVHLDGAGWGAEEGAQETAWELVLSRSLFSCFMACFKAALPKVIHSNGHSEFYECSSDCILDTEHKSMYLSVTGPLSFLPFRFNSNADTCWSRRPPTAASAVLSVLSPLYPYGSGNPSTLSLVLPQWHVGQAGHLSLCLQPFSGCCGSPEQQPAWEIPSCLPHQVLFPQKGTKVASVARPRSRCCSPLPQGTGPP